MKALTKRASFKPLLLASALILPLAGCGGHWDMSWNQNGRACRSGGYHGEMHTSDDALGSLVVLGIAGIAWGVHELAEAISGQ